MLERDRKIDLHSLVDLHAREGSKNRLACKSNRIFTVFEGAYIHTQQLPSMLPAQWELSNGELSSHINLSRWFGILTRPTNTALLAGIIGSKVEWQIFKKMLFSNQWMFAFGCSKSMPTANSSLGSVCLPRYRCWAFQNTEFLIYWIWTLTA